eukprot:jgi/Botrbrau1/4605/Bobra.60_2s0090.1
MPAAAETTKTAPLTQNGSPPAPMSQGPGGSAHRFRHLYSTTWGETRKTKHKISSGQKPADFLGARVDDDLSRVLSFRRRCSLLETLSPPKAGRVQRTPVALVGGSGTQIRKWK